MIEEGSPLFHKYGVEFQPGEIIFCEFEPGNNFYLIHKGRVKITKIVKDREKTMDILGPGDFFGEMAILEGEPRSASAIAIDNVVALQFNKENFVSLLTSYPQLAYKLLVVFSRRIYEAKKRLRILLIKDKTAKVAGVFLMLAEQDPHHMQLKKIVLPITPEEVANWCGESLEEIRGILDNFARLGRIEIEENKIVINNLPEIRRIVQTRGDISEGRKI